MSERVIVTSGLSKAYGIPGVRIGWIVAPASLTEQCWTQHDYLTIGPNKMSDRIARVAVEPSNRERCYARTREILHAESADRARHGSRALTDDSRGENRRPVQLR